MNDLFNDWFKDKSKEAKKQFLPINKAFKFNW
jgi:hypothetical protein